VLCEQCNYETLANTIKTKHPPNVEKKEQRERGPKSEVQGQNPKWWSLRGVRTNYVPKPSLVILRIQHTYQVEWFFYLETNVMSSLQRKTNLNDVDDHDLRYRMKYEFLIIFFIWINSSITFFKCKVLIQLIIIHNVQKNT
jgi:hypothetical protein